MTEINAQWQTDLADMQGISRPNGVMRYLLTVNNVFTKFGWAVVVHSEDAKAITKEVDYVFITAKPRQPRRLQTDKNKMCLN